MLQQKLPASVRLSLSKLYRRSNELDVRVIDMTGVKALAQHQDAGTSPRATVLQVQDRGVVVRLADGMETFVPKHEVVFDTSENLHDVVKVGDERDVTIRSVDRQQGTVRLSLLPSENDPLNDYQDGQMAQGEVVELQDKWIIVNLAPGVTGSVHVSQLGFGYVGHPSEVVTVGQRVTAQIDSIDRQRRRVVLTMRIPENDPFNRYEVDRIYTGTVDEVTALHAVVRLDREVIGRLHREEFWRRVEDVGAVLAPGEKIAVAVKSIDREHRRIVLSRRLRDIHPVFEFQGAEEITGRVIRVEPYGAFVQIEPEVRGLVHKSKIGNGVRDARSAVQTDATVQVTVVGIDEKLLRLNLAIRLPVAEPPKDPLEDCRPGTTRRGRVTGHKPFGVFVQLAPGLSGLVHVSALRGSLADWERLYPRGTEVEVTVLQVDLERRRVNLRITR